MRLEDTTRLTELQQAVINDSVYPAYLTASAGTGKTEVLVQKILQILANGAADISEIAVITFTNKATDEMEARIHDRLYAEWLRSANSGDEERQLWLRRLIETGAMMNISTIHGFCERLLHQYAMFIGLSPDFNVRTFRQESREIADKIITNRKSDPALRGLPQYRVQRLVLSILEYCENHGYALIDDYLTEAKDNVWLPLKRVILTICLEVRAAIDKQKREQVAMTLNDLMRRTVELLQNPYVLQLVAKTYKYLLIDEMQDTDVQQFHIAKLLIDAGVNVFLVGDDKQSIYSFRGADIQSSRQAAEVVKEINNGAFNYVLDENFRSDPELIERINAIFNKPFKYDGRQLSFPQLPLKSTVEKSEADCANPLRVMSGERISDVVHSIVDHDQIAGRQIEYGDINILCRTNRELAELEAQLRQDGIPVIIVGGKGFFASKEIVDTYKIFNAILSKDESAFNELRFTDYYDATIIQHGANGFDSLLVELDYLFREANIDEILEFLYEKSGVLEHFRQTGQYQAAANLRKLRSMTALMLSGDFMQPLDFLDYLDIMIETQPEEDEAEIDDPEERRGVVTLSTIHKAKGLSLPVVIIPNIDRPLITENRKPDFLIDHEQKRFALADIMQTGKTDPVYDKLLKHDNIAYLEEEIRVLYVAMTRAKHLLVLCSKRNSMRTNDVSWVLWVAKS